MSSNTPHNEIFSVIEQTDQKSTANTIPKKVSELSGLEIGNREIITDHYIPKDIKNNAKEFAYKIFVRLNAKKITFEDISFVHCIFDTCYMHGCVFNSCDFTGCRFIGSNFHQSSFRGCKFGYSIFERCQIDDDILESEAPREENLKMKFARSLRMNYQQTGDAKAVNKAISLELEATSSYLKKSWASNETYYQKKYGGLKRIPQFGKWLEFRFLDFIWGNGESIYKLARTIFLAILAISIYDVSLKNTILGASALDYIQSIPNSTGIFLGINIPSNYPVWASATIVAGRLLSVAFLTALLVKRLGRR